MSTLYRGVMCGRSGSRTALYPIHSKDPNIEKATMCHLDLVR